MRLPGRILVASAVVLGIAATGCGAEGGTSCTDSTCTIQSDGPQTYDLDQLGTKVEVSDLKADSVRVSINADDAVIRRGDDPVRMRGFLVSAPETSTDHVKVRIER
ncbi:hypothetical protein AB0L40_15070 [Patulibacter sp. NPDC049589]|uniref:hypothetical protein n=1 Tax=Patulibacter sp. NPDC049589 TaxID=3154731 RepID=UPI00343648FA